MYLLQFLEKAASRAAKAAAGDVDVEYRLACSGELYNRRVLTFDWRKSDVTRVLLRTPLELFVASHPFNDYPQELCARITLSHVTEEVTKGNSSASSTLVPDEDVMEDLCSILSLLSRRLISPIRKTRERRPNDSYALGVMDGLGSYALEFPAPIMPVARVAVWSRRPATYLTSMEGLRVSDNNPPPVGVDHEALADFLLKLPTIPNAVEIVYASRLYRAALELIESRPDIAYLLLISTVESLAAVALGDYEPTELEKLGTESAVVVQKCALKLGLDEKKAKLLALESSRGAYWLGKKFKKFLLDFVSLDELAAKDRVFLVPENFCPRKEDVPKALSRIYDARSGNLHRASPFPKSVGLGTSPWIKPGQLPTGWMFESSFEVPPVPWFERVVSIAALKFLLEKSSAKSVPFLVA
jgi:hypothetical protein